MENNCPRCGSTNITMTYKAISANNSNKIKTRWKCLSCKREPVKCFYDNKIIYVGCCWIYSYENTKIN